jgi:hypothetical protein
MPLNVDVLSVLVWAVPLFLLGALVGSGTLRRWLPSRGCFFLLVGWALGLLTLFAVAVVFPLEFGLVVARFAVPRWLRFSPAVVYVNPWVLFVGFLLAVSVVVWLVWRAAKSPAFDA